MKIDWFTLIIDWIYDTYSISIFAIEIPIKDTYIRRHLFYLSYRIGYGWYFEFAFIDCLIGRKIDLTNDSILPKFESRYIQVCSDEFKKMITEVEGTKVKQICDFLKGEGYSYLPELIEALPSLPEGEKKP